MPVKDITEIINQSITAPHPVSEQIRLAAFRNEPNELLAAVANGLALAASRYELHRKPFNDIMRILEAAGHVANVLNFDEPHVENVAGIVSGSKSIVANLATEHSAFAVAAQIEHDSELIEEGDELGEYLGGGLHEAPIGIVGAADEKIEACKSHILTMSFDRENIQGKRVQFTAVVNWSPDA